MEIQKLQFFLQALKNIREKDFLCPSCGNLSTKFIYRKMLVTSLRECNECGLRFRIPKDRVLDSNKFYQSGYEAGFTTSLPSDEQLKKYLSNSFMGGEKDFSGYIKVLDALGLKKGDYVLDFGSSWGYGSWQLQQAGYNVYSYEISKTRSDYARNQLGCRIVEDFTAINQKIKCVFSSHVIEHLPDPNIFWNITKQVLRPDGIVVCFTPNGEPELEKVYGTKRYNQLWGQVHPLLFTQKALKHMANRYNFVPYVYSYPYPLEIIKDHKDGELSGKELLLIARNTYP
jgi:2-polyprenyl-3-methyl-5-hydroxy-6-metoxy-1,4-benzoquinol methylase